MLSNYGYEDMGRRRWNVSEQALRMEVEQKALERCRTLKKGAEVSRHKIGTILPFNLTLSMLRPKKSVVFVVTQPTLF